MINVGRVQGSEAQAQPIVIGKDTVYVHENIVPITEDSEGNEVKGLFEYDEVQYTKDEWIDLLTVQGEETSAAVDDILTNILPAIMEGGIE